jgi:hypothetical protein
LRLEQSKSKSPDPETRTDFDEDHDIEQKRPVLDHDFSFAHEGTAEQDLDYPLSEGLVHIPEESVVGTESSDGQGLGFEEESDGDHEDDEDFLMELDDDAQGSNLDSDEDIYVREVQEPLRKPGKVKSVKVSSLFRPSPTLLLFTDRNPETH